MEMVNSKQKLLEMPTIVAMAASNVGTGKVPMASALASVAKEGTLPSADYVQIGNTVFLGHRGEDKNKNQMVGRAFNADIARNYIKNIVQYLEYLQNKGITHYSSQFKGQNVFNILQIVKKLFEGTNTDFMIARTKQEGTYRLMIRFGKKQ